MIANNKTKLVRAVKIIIDVIYGLLLFVSAAGVILLILYPTILTSRDIALTASVPVAIGSGIEPHFKLEIGNDTANDVQAAFINEAQGSLRLETTNWRFIVISYVAKLLTAIGLAYVFHLIRSVLKAFLVGSPFTKENILRIRRIGYAVLVVGFIRPAVEYLAASEILRQLTVINPALSLPSPFKAEVILASLLILILAQVWSYGLELEHDKALTI